MKIVFDGLIYSLQENGGITRYFDELINGLAERPDCEVVVLMRKNRQGKTFDPKVKVEIVNSSIYSGNRLLKYMSIFVDGFRTNKFLKDHRYSRDCVIHSTYYRHYRDLESKQVITVHDLIPERFPGLFGGLLDKLNLYNKRKAIANADMLISVSENTKADLTDLYGINPRKIRVVYHGVSKAFTKIASPDTAADLATDMPTKPARPFFLFVGNRNSYKNFSLILKAMNSWPKKDDFDLVCLGGGAFNARESDEIADLNLTKTVKCVPDASEVDLVSYYNHASAFIYPSLYEGFGLPILEAMACDTPVICSDIPVFHEIGGRFPLFFENDPVKLTDCLDKIASFGYPSTQLVKEAMDWTKRFTWEKTVEGTLDVYRGLLS